jgi:hypothetical protein
MNLTQVQIEEFRQAWKEVAAKLKGFGVTEIGIAVHDITKEVALYMDEDDVEPVIRVLKHAVHRTSTPCRRFSTQEVGTTTVRYLLMRPT